GLVEPCETTFDFHMGVTRIYESPRVTKPYTEEQWDSVLALGTAVDKELVEGDVRLTMGGEPTFVSIDDMEGPEWNTDAVGPNKEFLATTLIKRLQDRWVPQDANNPGQTSGLLIFGQGKWYPGEQLPRWAHQLIWRKDGKPIWRDRELLASPNIAGQDSIEDARTFIHALTDSLQISDEAIIEAYEDPWHFIEQEAKLPFNVTPEDNKIEDPQTRDRIARVFERGLSQITGFVLPVQRWNSPAQAPRWMSEIWKFRQGRLYLIPGDSTMGLRIPLDSLPYVAAISYPYVYGADPFSYRPPLPDPPPPTRRRRPPLRQQTALPASPGSADNSGPLSGPGIQGQKLPEVKPEPPDEKGLGGPVRTAISVESRNGVLHVFMPPVEHLEDYLDLIAKVEDAAAAAEWEASLANEGDA
ncbi:MAG: transglutaminase family protein, partial [Rhodospirillaceae bacterium]